MTFACLLRATREMLITEKCWYQRNPDISQENAYQENADPGKSWYQRNADTEKSWHQRNPDTREILTPEKSWHQRNPDTREIQECWGICWQDLSGTRTAEEFADKTFLAPEVLASTCWQDFLAPEVLLMNFLTRFSGTRETLALEKSWHQENVDNRKMREC
jgi:hypothetical protein